MSSPSRSPRPICPDHILTSAFWAVKPHADVTFLGSGQCSSPGSGQTSGHNSVGGDMLSQLFLQPTRGSPECSPVPSPRMISPGPSSRVHSGSVSPLHPRSGGLAPESPTSRHDDGKKKQTHKLPLPPLSIAHSPFFPNNSTPSSPISVPRSPGRTENPSSPASRWKKGKLIGRGTSGHVYVGFNRYLFSYVWISNVKFVFPINICFSHLYKLLGLFLVNSLSSILIIPLWNDLVWLNVSQKWYNNIWPIYTCLLTFPTRE